MRLLGPSGQVARRTVEGGVGENLMEKREYPVSVIETVTGSILWMDTTKDMVEMARKIKPIVERAKSPREVVKNLQPLIKEME